MLHLFLLPSVTTPAAAYSELLYVKIYSQFVWDSALLPDFVRGFGSRGVRAFDTNKPTTAPMAIPGKGSVCPPSSPSKRITVTGSRKTAHATPAIPAVTATPSGMNVRIWRALVLRVPPTNSNGKMGAFKACGNDYLSSQSWSAGAGAESYSKSGLVM